MQCLVSARRARGLFKEKQIKISMVLFEHLRNERSAGVPFVFRNGPVSGPRKYIGKVNKIKQNKNKHNTMQSQDRFYYSVSGTLILFKTVMRGYVLPIYPS